MEHDVKSAEGMQTSWPFPTVRISNRQLLYSPALVLLELQIRNFQRGPRKQNNVTRVTVLWI